MFDVASSPRRRRTHAPPAQTTLGRPKILLGLLILFLAYQLPQGLMLRTGSVGLFVAATLVFVVVAYAVARWTGGRGWTEYYLPLQRSSLLLLIGGLPLGIAASALGTWAGVRLGYVRVDHVVTWRSQAGYLAAVYAISFISSAAEDIVTRGYLLRHWPARLMKWFVPLSALAYVLNHIYVVTKGPSLWAFLYLLGAALAWPVWKTRNMWLTVGAHWGWNLVYHTVDVRWTTTTSNPAAARWSMALGSALLLLLMLAVTRVCRGSTAEQAETQAAERVL